MKTSALIVAGGMGSRMGGSVSKQLLKLEGTYILTHTIRAFEAAELIDEIILVVKEDEKNFVEKEIVLAESFKKVNHIVVGGRERYHSVQNGLAFVSGELVLIHDGARPLISRDLIHACVEALSSSKAAILAVPVKDTVKIASTTKEIQKTLDRSLLWLAQTPQAFWTQIIIDVYKRLDEIEGAIYDDASLVEMLTDHKVHIIQGSYDNIKVTTPEDLIVGETILKRRHEMERNIG